MENKSKHNVVQMIHRNKPKISTHSSGQKCDFFYRRKKNNQVMISNQYCH